MQSAVARPFPPSSSLGRQLTGAFFSPNADFKLHIGFGLHTGWAIEGAIGSHDKIDASYLSPHVNLSARLETATKQYGVGILISEHVYHMLSEGRKARCRKLDRVTVKGSKQPIAIYSNDLNMNTDSM